MNAILSFLGGATFRTLWGEVAHWFTAKQEHKYEMAKLAQAESAAAAQHERNMTALKVQSDLGVKMVEVQRDADLSKVDADAFLSAVKAVNTLTGIKWVDAWNMLIRPLLATMAIIALIQEVIAAGGVPTPHVLIICDAILGIYVADRSLGKRGK